MPSPKLTKDESPPRNITKKELQLWESLGDQAREAEAHARGLRKDQMKLSAEIRRFVEAKAGKKRSLERSGFRLSIVSKLKGVSWLEQFRDRHGQELVDQIKAEQPTVDSLQIERIK